MKSERKKSADSGLKFKTGRNKFYWVVYPKEEGNGK